jgi:hypothetical protein
MKNTVKAGNVQIKGFVFPHDWDRHGNVVQFSLLTDEFDRYIIAENKEGGELQKLIDRQIRAEGTIVGEDLFGNKILLLTGFNLINER